MLNFLCKMRIPLMLWASVTLFFAFQFILRLSPGLLMDEIMVKYGVDTLTFAAMLSMWYLSYSLMQIPFGIMLDKFNFRYVTIVAIFTCIIGNTTFILAENWTYVVIGRFLIGAGSATCFLSVAKVIKLFFEEKHQPFMIGFSFTFGLTGAVFGSTPTKILIDNFGYNAVLTALSFVGIAIALLIFLVNDKKIIRAEDESINQEVTFKDILSIFMNYKILIIGISGGMMVGSLEGFADVWVFRFFTHLSMESSTMKFNYFDDTISGLNIRTHVHYSF